MYYVHVCIILLFIYFYSYIWQCFSVININKPLYVDQHELKQALVAFPTLQAAIFPSKSKRLTPAESQDVSVYELLKASP